MDLWARGSGRINERFSIKYMEKRKNPREMEEKPAWGYQYSRKETRKN